MANKKTFRHVCVCMYDKDRKKETPQLFHEVPYNLSNPHTPQKHEAQMKLSHI